jgi:hypothetical protein
VSTYHEPSAAEREAFLAAGNTQAQLVARIRDGVPLDRDFAADDVVLLDSDGHGQAWRSSTDDTWHELQEPAPVHEEYTADDIDDWTL